MNDQSDQEFQTELEQLRRFLTYRISRVHWKLNTQASKILSETVGLSLTQWRILAFIGGSESITASELVKVTAMDKGLISRNVKTMIQNGVVVSTGADKDHRVNLLTLTPKGREIFEIALPRMRQRQVQLQRGIAQTDIDAFHRVLDALDIASENLDPS